MPLELYSGLPIRQNQVSILNGGYKTTKTFGAYAKYLPSEGEVQRAFDTSRINSQKYGDNLTKWTDELFSMFYNIKKLCVTTARTADVCGIKLSNCKNTNWSSYAVDSKSAIGVINETTGTFNIW